MNFEVEQQVPLEALDTAMHNAQEPTLDLLAKIISGACTRISRQAKTETFNRLIDFAKTGAWTEAAFALIALELPLWRVRRLAYENGGSGCARCRTSQIYQWRLTTARKPLMRFCLWRCSALSSKRAADAMPCESPYRLFPVSSQGRGK